MGYLTNNTRETSQEKRRRKKIEEENGRRNMQNNFMKNKVQYDGMQQRLKEKQERNRKAADDKFWNEQRDKLFKLSESVRERKVASLMPILWVSHQKNSKNDNRMAKSML